MSLLIRLAAVLLGLVCIGMIVFAVCNWRALGPASAMSILLGAVFSFGSVVMNLITLYDNNPQWWTPRELYWHLRRNRVRIGR